MDAKLLLPFPSLPAALHPAVPKSLFLGASLPLRPPPFPLRLRPRRAAAVVAQAAVKRRKEVPFDNVIQRDKKLKLVLKLRNILVAQPDRVMSLRDLGRFRRDLGLTRKRRLIALLKRFPGVFDIVEEGVYSLRFRLTPRAERLYLDDLRLKNESEGLAVAKLRKLLMMSQEKRILIEKIAHLKHDLGLPPEFRDTICLRYPQYFRIVRMDRGPALELTHWDPELAVSAAELAEEENRVREAEERNLIIDRPLKFNRVRLPKGLKLTRGEARRIAQFKEMPYISPYADFSHLRSGSAEKEKHARGVVHEILSLTVEKRTLVDHLTHFREEFRFSQSLRGMIIRHPDMFYVSFKGDRDSVFLREAYKDSQLVEKNKLVLLKEKMRALVAVPRFPRRGTARIGEEGEGINGSLQLSDKGSDEECDEDEGLSDMEDLISELSGGKSDADYQWGDGWFGENDDAPPDFGDDYSSPQEVKVAMKNADGSANGRAPVPVFPDGRPRERCDGMGVKFDDKEGRKQEMQTSHRSNECLPPKQIDEEMCTIKPDKGWFVYSGLVALPGFPSPPALPPSCGKTVALEESRRRSAAPCTEPLIDRAGYRLPITTVRPCPRDPERNRRRRLNKQQSSRQARRNRSLHGCRLVTREDNI